MGRSLWAGGLVLTFMLTGAYFVWPRQHYTPEEQMAITVAKDASVRAGWWEDGYEIIAVSHSHRWDGDRRGWFVGFAHPGHYTGGHHGVVVDENYRLVRLIGGK